MSGSEFLVHKNKVLCINSQKSIFFSHVFHISNILIMQNKPNLKVIHDLQIITDSKLRKAEMN